MLSPLPRIAFLSSALLTAAASVFAVSTTGPVLDRTVLKDLPVELPLTVKSMGSAAERLGRFARIPLGVEDSIEPVLPSATEPGPLALTSMKVHDALERLTRLSIKYEWRQVANVVVIRPKIAWQNSESPLHRRIESVEWKSVTFAEALDKTMSLLSGMEYRTPQPTPDDRRFDVMLRRATLLQLLNTVVLEHGELVWHVGYRNGDRAEQFGIGFTTFAGHGRWVWIPTLEKTRTATSAKRD